METNATIKMTRTKKDSHIEHSLALMNDSMAEAERLLIKPFDSPEHPIVFVIGAQRSGTTVLTQTLAVMYRVSYPSNLIARFWRAPYLGELLRRSLNLDEEKMVFRSEFGATLGVNGPHEFSYFWRHWFPGSAKNARPFHLPDEQASFLKKEFAAWQSAGNEPLLFKNLLEVIPNIHELASLLPTAYFVNIIRNDLFVIQSTYECRKKYGGDHTKWFGVRPSNFREIMNNPDPLLQVVDQVYYLKREIDESLARLPENRHLSVRYEDLVSHTGKTVGKIEERCGLKRWRRRAGAIESLDLLSGNEIRLSDQQIEAIHTRWRILGRA